MQLQFKNIDKLTSIGLLEYIALNLRWTYLLWTYLENCRGDHNYPAPPPVRDVRTGNAPWGIPPMTIEFPPWRPRLPFSSIMLTARRHSLHIRSFDDVLTECDGSGAGCCCAGWGGGFCHVGGVGVHVDFADISPPTPAPVCSCCDNKNTRTKTINMSIHDPWLVNPMWSN